MSDLRRWKERRWWRNPYCHWCGVRTVLFKRGTRLKAPPSNLATVDHLRDRYDPTRTVPANGDVRRVLSCLKCNHDRGRQETAARPIEELHERSGRHGMGAAS